MSRHGSAPDHKAKGSSKAGSLTHLLAELDQPKKAYNALVGIRKLAKDEASISRIRKQGGLKKLLKLVNGHGDEEKQLNVALSILGNSCTDDKCRNEMLHLDGIPILAKVLLECSHESIQNRACRCLANLAQMTHCCAAIHDLDGTVEKMAQLLQKTQDVECQQTYIRALRMLGDTPRHKAAVVQCYGLKAIADCLKSEDAPVLQQALKCVAHFLHKDISQEHAWQLSASEAFASIVNLTSHDLSAIQREATSLLLQATNEEKLRPLIGNGGAVSTFLATIKDEGLATAKKYPYINALCQCCQEVVNRNKIREGDGLELMMKLLKDPECSRIHDRLISALVFFLHDDRGFGILLRLDIVDVLTKRLASKRKDEETQSRCSFAELKEGLEVMLERREIDNQSPCEDSGTEFMSGGSSYATSKSAAEADTSWENDSAKPNIKTCPFTGDDRVKELECENMAGESEAMMSFDEENTVKRAQGEVGNSPRQSTGHQNSRDVFDSKTTEAQPPNDEQCSTKDSDITTDRSIQDRIKYSIDSPTYKAVSDWKLEDSYENGPRNISESQWYYQVESHSPARSSSGGSSPSYSGPYSPLSVASSSFSPEGSPRAASPKVSFRSSGMAENRSPSASSLTRGFSPAGRSPSELDFGGSFSPLESGYSQDFPARETLSDWSPLSFHGDVGSPPLSPERLPSRMSAARKIDLNVEQYSSEEDNDDINIDFTKPEPKKDEIIGCHEHPILETVEEAPSLGPVGSASAQPGNHVIQNTSPNRFLSLKCQGLKRKRPSDDSEVKKKKCSPENPVEVEVYAEEAPGDINIEKISQAPAKHSKKDNDARKTQEITEHNILIILSRVSYMDDPLTHLVQGNYLERILEYILESEDPQPRATRILLRLLSNPLCLEKLIVHLVPVLIELKCQTGPPARICTVPSEPKSSLESGKPLKTTLNRTFSELGLTSDDEAMDQPAKPACERLRESLMSAVGVTASSRCGQGTVRHLLLAPGKQGIIRCKSIMCLPFIYRDKELLQKISPSVSSILDCIVTMLEKSNVTLQLYGIQALAVLAKTFQLGKSSHMHIPGHPDSEHAHVDQAAENLTFILGDGEKIEANKEILVRKSSVFAAMLDGSFRESSQQEIRIPDASSKAFNALVTHLHGDHDLEELLEDLASPKCESAILDLALELLSLSNRFLFVDLHKYVAHLITSRFLTFQTSCRIFKVAVVHNSPCLAERSLSFMLNVDVPLVTRWESFQQLLGHEVFRCKDNDNILEDICRIFENVVSRYKR